MQNTYEVRPVVGYEGKYSISNTGEVFSHNYRHTGKTKQLKPIKHNDGYFIIGLWQDGQKKIHKVHRLVLEAFVPNPENKSECDHIDTDRKNNHVSNLRWVTKKENNNNPLTRKNLSEAKKDKIIYTFRNKKTKEVFIGTRYDFYTKYDLYNSHVSDLLKGKRNHHKGWVLV